MSANSQTRVAHPTLRAATTAARLSWSYAHVVSRRMKVAEELNAVMVEAFAKAKRRSAAPNAA